MTHKAFFAPNESIPFSFDTAPLSSAAPSSSSFTLCWRRTGDDGKTESGHTQVGANSVGVIQTSLDQPGFVQLAVTPLDEKGDVVPLPGRGRPPYRFGAGVSPQKLAAPPEPNDFDLFWSRQKAKLSATPLAAEQTSLGIAGGMRIFSVRIDCPDVVRPATGYLAIPAGAPAKSLPARVCFQGYGTFPQTPGAGEEGWIVLEINAHGFDLGREPAYYRDFFQKLRVEQNGRYAFHEAHNATPETSYFLGMALRALRALEFVKGLPEWNGRVLEVKGVSQGGLQACWAAGLDRDVSQIRIGNVWCCNLAGSQQKGRLPGDAPAFTPALGYYDPVYHARRFHAKKLRVFSAALGDEVCPPAGQALLYQNASVRDKRIDWVQGASHTPVPGARRQIFRWKGNRNHHAEYRIETLW